MPTEISTNPNRFAGTVALLSGAASGIGRATATRLAAEGASIYALDVNDAGLRETGESIRSTGGTFAARPTDVTSVAECRAAVADCVDEFGRIDVLGNIAGIAAQHHIADVDEATWDRMHDVNTKGPFFLTQAALPHLKESAGNIVMIASNAGLMGQAYTVPYCASKGAVVNMTRAIAMELVKEDVRINAIAPGGVATPLYNDFALADNIDFDLMKNYVGFRPAAEAEEIAALFAYLASSDARSIHGSIVSIDGGLTAS